MRQKKTGRPVWFELTEQTRQAIDEYLRVTHRKPGELLFPGRGGDGHGLTTRQYEPVICVRSSSDLATRRSRAPFDMEKIEVLSTWAELPCSADPKR